MRVRDLMTQKVFTVHVDKTLLVVDEIMTWARIRHVPVVDAQNRLVGLISHRRNGRSGSLETGDGRCRRDDRERDRATHTGHAPHGEAREAGA